ncbi:MAG: NTP transferase domain-containing protein [Gemmatimonadaceae bacterium]|nr:NTP transferase domain-containing protein [Planctomycetota bacterium]NUQ11984.1 NTP transferase domain-containing protein [Gemmatimonadaceae bacterium]
MKGVVLCGGTGSRLDPLTRVTNKHLLPIYDRPMVFYPIQTLVDAGIDDIMLVTGGNNAGDFVPLLGNGADFGLKHINYTYQKGAGGIADALRLCRHFVGRDRVAVILGDNVFSPGVAEHVRGFSGMADGAVVFLKGVDDPARFGVAEVAGGRVVGIEEKPAHPKSNLAVTGLYLYDHTVFDLIATLKPSGRGELEITDVNNGYLRRGSLRHCLLPDGIQWTDAGTFESLHRANLLAAEFRGKGRP